MAPLEEVTGYVFRNAYHAHFYPFDKYFAPFVAAKEQKGRLFNYKERNDILPENNRGIILIPQILTNNSEAFIRTARGMREYGYEEINLNLGCPSKTVVNGGRGSGFLQDREGLRKFLDKIFEQLDMKISIKTRLGRYEPEEIGPLMEIFNDYPLEELIIHPRVREVYTKEAETADQYIEKTVHEIGRKYRVTVATSDQLEQVIILGQGGQRMSARELLEDVIEVSHQIRETARQKSSSEKNYLFDHLDEETATRMERIRLGEEEV